jgi:putative lipoic acid-binding regulatory protein
VGCWGVQINEYPDFRVFKGIGEGGQSFVESMISAVESVVGPVAADNVRENKSSGGRYISVSVGPVCVTSGDQVCGRFIIKSGPLYLLV